MYCLHIVLLKIQINALKICCCINLLQFYPNFVIARNSFMKEVCVCMHVQTIKHYQRNIPQMGKINSIKWYILTCLISLHFNNNLTAKILFSIKCYFNRLKYKKIDAEISGCWVIYKILFPQFSCGKRNVIVLNLDLDTVEAQTLQLT